MKPNIGKPIVLGDHRREGSVFKPPFSRLINLDEISWIKTILPELIWIGFILDRHDLRPGAELALSCSEAARKAKKADNHLWFAAISTFDALSDSEKTEVRDELAKSGMLDQIIQAIEPLLVCYPRCPLSFLLKDVPGSAAASTIMIDRVKEIVSSLFSKRERIAVLTLSQGVYTSFASGKLHVKKDSSLANLEAVREYPSTEESRKVAASVRATCNILMSLSLKEHDAGWAGYFWKRGFEISKCTFELPYSL